MEKQTKIKPIKETVNVTKIYETIKDKGFIQDLWLDIMSDMKEKPSYKHLKGMVEKVIESSVESYNTKPKDPEERLKTRTIFTDLSIMTYTIDTLISELLYKKLKDEFKSIISNIVDEIKSNPESLVIEDNQADDVGMLEDIGKIICNGKEDHAHLRNEASGELSKSLGSRNLRNNDVNKRNKRYSRTVKKCHASSHANNSNSNEDVSIKNENINVTSNKFSSKSKKLLENQKLKTKNSDKLEKKEYPWNKSYGAVSREENSDVDIINVTDEDDENCSFRSVSSVHTSDLSSFEDDVSISSEDEYGAKIKKRVPLKLATDLYTRGRISDLHEISRKKYVRKHSTDMIVPQKSSFESPNQRLSARMRKPNSKYASDDMVCPIKLLSNQTESYEEVYKSFNNFESPKIEKIVSHEKKGKRGRPSKVISNNEEISSRSSFSSEDSPINSEDRIEVNPCSSSSFKSNISDQTVKQVKRGRPPKNINSQEDNKPTYHKNETGAIKKRGRPLKIKSVVSLSDQDKSHSFAASIDLYPKSHSKQPKIETSLETQWKNSLTNTETELKRKRGRPSTECSAKKACEDPLEHSVESFSQFEERLCLKDQKISSPSKNSTKSYSASDLYKPRSDFRVSFNSSRGSKALTLFSN